MLSNFNSYKIMLPLQKFMNVVLPQSKRNSVFDSQGSHDPFPEPTAHIVGFDDTVSLLNQTPLNKQQTKTPVFTHLGGSSFISSKTEKDLGARERRSILRLSLQAERRSSQRRQADRVRGHC